MYWIFKCDNCNYSFQYMYGFMGICSYMTCSCNDCKRYFIARIPPKRWANHSDIYRKIKAVAVYDDEEKVGKIFSMDDIFCENCGGQNVKIITPEDAFESENSCILYEKVKLRCIYCDRKFSIIGKGIFDG